MSRPMLSPSGRAYPAPVCKTPAERLNRVPMLRSQVSKAGLAAMRAGSPLQAPLQIEIHPYHISQGLPCSNDCLWCTRGSDRAQLRRADVVGIVPDTLVRFVSSMRGRGIAEFALAGNCTEPLRYPDVGALIAEIKATGAALRLYTNALEGDVLVSVADRATEEDVVRCSVDAGSAASYRLTHRPLDPHAFERVLENIAGLLQRRAALGRHFAVVVTYLLNQANAVPADIAFMMQWAARVGVDVVSFTRPLRPSDTQHDFFPLSNEQERVAGLLIEQLGGELGGRTRFVFTSLPSDQGPKPFRQCHYWKACAVLGSRGTFFPCTSVATGRYAARLAGPDIHSPGLDFWEFWADAAKWRAIDVNRCPECTRAEFALNSWIEGLG